MQMLVTHLSMQFRTCFPWKMFKYSLVKDQSKWNHRKPFLPHQFSSVQLLSRVRFFATPWTAVPRLPCPSPTPGACSNLGSLIQWFHPAISSSVIPFSSCLQSFLASRFFQWVSSSNQMAKVLEFQLQHQCFQWIFRTDFLEGWLVWCPCSPRDSQ